MAKTGPVPKRSKDILGHRTRAELAQIVKTQVEGEVVSPEPPADLHADAIAWYLSLRESGQSIFYEPSDWHFALFVARQMSELISLPISAPAALRAGMISVVISGTDRLLATEQARRRARVEIERITPGKGEGEKPEELNDYRSRLTVVDTDFTDENTASTEEPTGTAAAESTAVAEPAAAASTDRAD